MTGHTQPGLDASHRLAAAYVRRSTDRQEQSLGDQKRAIQAYANHHGFEIARIYEDDAISGASVEARDAFLKMMEDAKAPDRPWRHILVYDVSRFSRGDLDEAGHLRYQFRQAGVEIVYCNEGLTGGDSDDLMVGMKQWMAQRYVKDLSKVTIRGQVTYAETGSWSGGTPPYGYDVLYVDASGQLQQLVRWRSDGDKEAYDPESQKLMRVLPRGTRIKANRSDRARLVPSLTERVAVIQRIFRASVEEGRGFKPIADGLNRDGIPSPRDGTWSKNTLSKWSVGTIRAILRNPAYRGDSVWNRRTFAKFHRVKNGTAIPRPRLEADKQRENNRDDWIVVEKTHKPLVPPTIFDRCQELMKARGRNAGPKTFRTGSGLRSPYLLSGLITCGRCGQRYQGRVVNSSKRRKDGSQIKTFYYACGGYVMKGNHVCEKFLLRRMPLEDFILGEIADRVKALTNGEGEALLRQFIEEELAAQGENPGREMAQIRKRLAEIDDRASVLLEGLSDETRGFVDGKLRDLATEKRRLQQRLEELESVPYTPIDADAVLKQGLAALDDLPRLMASGSLEERKEFMHAFVAGITVHPDEERLDVLMRKIPVTALPQPGDSSVGMVAGAGFEPATFGL